MGVYFEVSFVVITILTFDCSNCPNLTDSVSLNLYSLLDNMNEKEVIEFILMTFNLSQEQSLKLKEWLSS